MQEPDEVPGYHIWGVDHTAYGPVELPTLVNWIKDQRVLADSWIFVESESAWQKASEVPVLKMFFRAKPTPDPESPAGAVSAEIKPGALRRIKVLAEMTDDQLACLFRFIEVVPVRQFTHLVRKGDPGDAMYGVLEGELRSCISVDGKECPLATLGPGSVFGEISLFDRGPHAVDVLANQDSVLAKISTAALAGISKEAPDAASALLLGLIQAIAGRVRTLTKRYEDSVQIAHRTEAIDSSSEAVSHVASS